MKKLMAAAAAAATLALVGCASDLSAEEREAIENDTYTEQAQEAREGAPTVYEESATGGSGTDESVIIDGERWDTQSEPMGEEPQEGEVTSEEDDATDE